uniref:SH3 domain-containing protein n=1 Tax=Steinernema glaseri TaxID=37863 RepID=A0A1I7Y0N4_9BILA
MHLGFAQISSKTTFLLLLLPPASLTWLCARVDDHLGRQGERRAPVSYLEDLGVRLQPEEDELFHGPESIGDYGWKLG